MKKYITLYLDDEVVEKVDDIAKKEERSRSYVIKKILNQHFNKNK